MYTRRSYGHSTLAKSVLNQGNDVCSGFSCGSELAWATAAGRLYVWRFQDDSSSQLTSLFCPGVTQHVWLYQYPNNGALVIAACSTTGQLYSWLDANSAVDPITTHLAPSGTPAASPTISAFGAAPVRGPDAPGFVAAVSFSDGSIAMVSAARNRVSYTTIRSPSQCTIAPRGLFKALNEAVKVPDEESWMHALGRGEDRWWVSRAIGTFVGATQRDHASSAACSHIWLQHNGGASWIVLTLSAEALDCWYVSHTGGALLPLRLEVQLDTVCVLVGLKQEGRRSVAPQLDLALAFLKLPRRSTSGVWATVPECHFFQPLNVAVRQEDAAEAAKRFSLCLRPEAARVSAENPSAALITCITPSPQHHGGLLASQLVTWSPRDGPAVALPEIMDACSLSWSAGEDSWQLLSPIFGVLMLQQVDNTQRAVMPVAPLLEAAVTRQIAGDGMPGLADALNSHKALTAEPSRVNAVEEFSDALVNTLPKDAAAAAAAHGGIGDTLLRKQQQHNALLQCLHSAGLLASGACEERGAPQLPAEAIFGLFQHSEHLSAAASLFYECCASSGTSAAAQTDTLEALAIASALIEPPADQRHTASEWVFSSPSSNLPLLMRGVVNACVSSNHTSSPELMEPIPIGRLAALCDLTCAVLKGARSAQQAASAQFGRFYEPWLPKGGAGWLAGKDVRHACIALVKQCLQACRSGVPEVWLERLLALGGHIVTSYKRTVDGAMTEGVPEAEIEGLVAEAQVAISSIITVIRSNALGTQSAQGSSMLQLEGYATSQRPSMTALLPSGSKRSASVVEDSLLRQRLQVLASSALESSSTAVQQPRIACSEQLLELCDEHSLLEHRRSLAACGQAPGPLTHRLLALIPQHLHAFEGQVVKAQAPPLSPAEEAARETLHSFMHQHPSFLMHVLHTYCSQRRAIELLLLPEAFHDRIADMLASDAKWRGMEWLFLNARGKHTEASSVLSKLVVSGDASGDAAKLLAPSADPKGLPLRAALLRKATVLLRMRKNAAADDAAAAAATEALAHNTGTGQTVGTPREGGFFGGISSGKGGSDVSTGLATGGTARSTIIRDYDEGEVLLAAQKLRMRLQAHLDVSETALMSMPTDVAGSDAVKGLDIDKVLDAAASCKDLDLMMQGLQVASKLIACNGGWLERQRDVTWAALWRGLATIDHRHFDQQHILSMQGSAVGSNESLHDSALYQAMYTCAALLKKKPALAMQAADAALEHAQDAVKEATGSSSTTLIRALHDRALSSAGVVPAS